MLLTRGEAMQAASDTTDGSMVSVIGLKSENVQEICDAAAKQSGAPVQVKRTKEPVALTQNFFLFSKSCPLEILSVDKVI